MLVYSSRRGGGPLQHGIAVPLPQTAFLLGIFPSHLSITRCQVLVEECGFTLTELVATKMFWSFLFFFTIIITLLLLSLLSFLFCML